MNPIDSFATSVACRVFTYREVTRMELVLHDILMNIVLRLKVNTFQFFTGFMPHCIDRPQPKVVVENFDGNKWEESMEMKGADISKRSKQ